VGRETRIALGIVFELLLEDVPNTCAGVYNNSAFPCVIVRDEYNKLYVREEYNKLHCYPVFTTIRFPVLCL
jgi:hypothetical protein